MNNDTTTTKARVLIELEELDSKLCKLNKFIATDAYSKLSEVQRELLQVQFDTMQMYARILRRRLNYWGE